jgi:hypothetical protein
LGFGIRYRGKIFAGQHPAIISDIQNIKIKLTMEHLTDLKAILHSKRANIYYLEKCRVMQKDGRVLYLTEAKDQNYYWNIPIANTTVILLGTGISIMHEFFNFRNFFRNVFS